MQRHLITTLLLLCALAACRREQPVQQPTDPNLPPVNIAPFTSKLPETYRHAGVAQVGSTVYFIGGYGEGNSHDHVTAFDLATRAATARAPIPYARHEVGVAVMDGAIYAIGGSGQRSYDDNEIEIRRRVERYDPASDRWTALGHIDDRDYDGLNPQGVAACAGRLYTISTRRTSHTFSLYESSDGITWTTRRTTIPACQEPTLVAAEGRLYLIGKYDTAATPFMYAYDPTGGTFTPRTPPAVNERGYTNTCFEYNGRIYKLNTLAESLAPMEIYTIATDTWSTLTTPGGLSDNRVYHPLVTNDIMGEVYLTSLDDVRRGYYFQASNHTFYVKR